MAYVIIILFLIGIIGFLSYRLYVKDVQYKYKAEKMTHLEHDYANKIQGLESAVDSLNKTAYTHTVTKIGNIDYFINRCTSLFEIGRAHV